jgi:hypothetical protein
MALQLCSENDGKLMVVHLSGKLHKEDYVHFVPAFEEAVKKVGKLRILMEKDFHGWDIGGLWEDIKFDMKHFKDIDRLAMIGEKKWEQWMAKFCKPFTSATIKYFTYAQSAEARAWITAA